MRIKWLLAHVLRKQGPFLSAAVANSELEKRRRRRNYRVILDEATGRSLERTPRWAIAPQTTPTGYRRNDVSRYLEMRPLWRGRSTNRNLFRSSETEFEELWTNNRFSRNTLLPLQTAEAMSVLRRLRSVVTYWFISHGVYKWGENMDYAIWRIFLDCKVVSAGETTIREKMLSLFWANEEKLKGKMEASTFSGKGDQPTVWHWAVALIKHGATLLEQGTDRCRPATRAEESFNKTRQSAANLSTHFFPPPQAFPSLR